MALHWIELGGRDDGAIQLRMSNPIHRLDISHLKIREDRNNKKRKSEAGPGPRGSSNHQASEFVSFRFVSNCFVIRLIRFQLFRDSPYSFRLRTRVVEGKKEKSGRIGE